MVIEVIRQVALTQIFIFPLVVWLGVLTLGLFLIVFLVGMGLSTGKLNVPLKWHMRLAFIAVLSAVIHGAMALSLFM